MAIRDRVMEAQELIFEQTPVDWIMDYRVAPDFVEIVGSAGGDVLVYRVYNDGSIYER